MDLTPSFFISLAVLLISIGGLVWALSSKLGKAATERDLYDLERKLTKLIEDQRYLSQQTHGSLATKQELEEVEKEMRQELKEFRVEVRESLTHLTTQHADLLKAISGLAHQITARRTNG